MADAVRIDVFGIECNTDVPDANGVRWTVRTSEDDPDVTGGRLNPTGRHGAALLPQLRGVRAWAPTGMAFASTQEAAFAAREQLRAIGFGGAEGDIVWHETVPKFVTVTQQDAALVTPPVDGELNYGLALVSAFPFRRAVEEKTVTLTGIGPETVVNDGTVPAFPMVTVVMAGNVDLVIGGRHFTTDVLPDDAVIDMWARTIKDSSGVDISPWPKHSETEWLAVPPGSNSVEQLGVATLDFTIHDTYA